MTSKSVITPFIISLFIAPLILALTMSLSGDAGATTVTRSLFAMTVLVEMGGGAVARVWNMVVVAGIARAGSFLILALLSRWSLVGAQFAEQYAIWIFAGCWLIAALCQQEVLPRVADRLEAKPA